MAACASYSRHVEYTCTEIVRVNLAKLLVHGNSISQHPLKLHSSNPNRNGGYVLMYFVHPYIMLEIGATARVSWWLWIVTAEGVCCQWHSGK